MENIVEVLVKKFKKIQIEVSDVLEVRTTKENDFEELKEIKERYEAVNNDMKVLEKYKVLHGESTFDVKMLRRQTFRKIRNAMEEVMEMSYEDIMKLLGE